MRNGCKGVLGVDCDGFSPPPCGVRERACPERSRRAPAVSCARLASCASSAFRCHPACPDGGRDRAPAMWSAGACSRSFSREARHACLSPPFAVIPTERLCDEGSAFLPSGYIFHLMSSQSNQNTPQASNLQDRNPWRFLWKSEPGSGTKASRLHRRVGSLGGMIAICLLLVIAFAIEHHLHPR